MKDTEKKIEKKISSILDEFIARDDPNNLFDVYEEQTGKEPVPEEGGHTEEFTLWFVTKVRKAVKAGCNTVEAVIAFIRNDEKILLKVAGKSVAHALGFFTDGCHKIYVAETEEDVKTMKGYDYGEMHPMTALEKTFVGSCPLRFISWVNLDKPIIVPQCAERVTFTYNTGKSVAKFHN